MSPLIYKKQNKNQKWRKLETMFVCGLYHTTCMHSADYGVVRCMSVRLSFCLSVCLSVTRRYSIETVIHILKVFFTFR